MKILKISLFILVLLSFVLTVNAANFTGYTYNTTGGALNATNVTIEVWNDETAEPSLNTSYSTLSNESGNWNLTIPDSNLVTGKGVKFIPRHFNGSYLDYIGANLPSFPYDDMDPSDPERAALNTSAINFYLKEGATVNITAINSSGGAVNFSYMVKDVRLGFPIESEWQTPVFQKTIYLPADRNYSIEIFPAQAMPIYYDLNNLSDYSSPKKAEIIFNTTTSPVRVTGRFNLSNGTGTFDEINIINYLLEPGDMVFAGQAMPYNMSAWDDKTDAYNATSGEYNISLQGTAMSSKVLMFAIAKSGNDYYGGFRNISPTIAGGDISGFNFTLYKLLGSAVNITLNKAVSTETGGTINVTASKTTFAFVNSSSDVLATATGHLEIELKYSGLNSDFPDFTWMFDMQQRDQGRFTLPFLNYSIKKLNTFTQNYAPLKLAYTAAQLDVSQVNITMRAFNPGGIDSDFGGIEMEMFRSSAECDVPYPPYPSCDLAGAGGEKEEDDFKPLNAVISGGKISFRIKKGSIVIHYKNVDLIASGPPDAAFDDTASSSSSGGAIEEVWRFGSLGPEIYDGLLIGFPYSGIDDSYDMNISLPYLYSIDNNNNWNLVWNTSANGTTGISTNLTDYADYNESWFSGMNCSKTDQTANCFINTTENIVWIQLPHFSAFSSSASGTASSSPSAPSGGGSSGSSSGGGGGIAAVATAKGVSASKMWSVITVGENTMKISKEEIAIAELVINMKNQVTGAEVIVVKPDEKPEAVAIPTGELYQYLEIVKREIQDADIQDVKIIFKVTKSWLTTNNINEGDVVLRKYTTSWLDLPTKKISSDSSYVTYEATTSGFSYFAITGKKAEIKVAEAIEKEEEAEAEEEVKEAAAVEEITEETPIEKPWFKWIIISAAIVIGLAICFVLMEKGKKK